MRTGKLLPEHMDYYQNPGNYFLNEYGISPEQLKEINIAAVKNGNPIKRMSWDEVVAFLTERALAIMPPESVIGEMKLLLALLGRVEVPVFACRHPYRPNIYFSDTYIDEPIQVLSEYEKSVVLKAEQEGHPLEFVVLVPCKDNFNYDNKTDFKKEYLCDVGVIAGFQVIKDAEIGEDMVRMRALERVRVLWKDGPSLVAVLEHLPEIKDVDFSDPQVKEKLETIAMIVKNHGEGLFPPRALNLWKAIPAVIREGKLGSLLDSFPFFVGLDSMWEADLFPYRYAVLKANSLSERLEKTYELASLFDQRVTKLKEISAKRVKNQAEEQNKIMLRVQRDQLNKQLGDENEEIAGWEARLKELEGLTPPLPAIVIKEARKQLEKIKRYKPDDSPYGKIAEWLESNFFSLPWTTRTNDDISLERAREILDEDHFGLSHVKERVLSYLALVKEQEKFMELVISGKAEMRPEHKKRTVLCFVGPPGVAKTSLGRSIARAMGRNFYATSFGGVEDEHEIHGFAETYLGSMPGQIIRGLIQAGSKNPVFMIDEIDKMKKVRGNPESAFLAVLDSTLDGFTDKFMRVPFDLSEVLFITTANNLDGVMPALLDRMEIIEFPGYTAGEKLEIAKRFLIPKALEYHHLPEVSFSDEALEDIRDEWTDKEAGVRTYERQISAVCRKLLVENRHKVCLVRQDMLPKLLGPRSTFKRPRPTSPEIGVATGLAASDAGGSILFVEVERYVSSSKYAKLEDQIFATGSIMDVMKESMIVALARVRKVAENDNNKFGVTLEDFEKSRFHVHFAPMATKKEGPSATITIFVALMSALSGRAVDHKYAMTGELTLRGKMLPVGGLAQKFSAAHREGIRFIIYPSSLQETVDYIKEANPELKEMDFVPIATDEEAISRVLIN
ncbi:MAG: hypothetical protein COU46_00295 [Candidatus Niyogibacteria bacterium CG10_big_fil_rev_8_21_14_0_10_42_19]|uniref:endopeptidase La n=1 Tax=Candidatus Niyogibacteria bacterium CG10_big_fil_rev_8_21_14_0_10_42_19 TaxID=1974725 RepID=A0A2H0TI78_9BACT|nr:MAG: hypothetical protein COU46_00295 [Candidatus Niyogibacteria bacterium CG10_big_fil_rev_8_21_14_0_10_42_19]